MACTLEGFLSSCCCCCGGCCCVTKVHTGEVGLVQCCGAFRRLARPGLQLLVFPFETLAHRVSTRVRQLQVSTKTKTRDNVTLSVSVTVQYQVLDRLLPPDEQLLSTPRRGCGEGGGEGGWGLGSAQIHPVLVVSGAAAAAATEVDGSDESLLGAPAQQAMARGAGAGGAGAVRGGRPEDEGVWRAQYRLGDAAAQIESYVEDVVRSELPRKTLDEAYEAKDDVAVAVKAALQQEMARFGYEVVQALVTDLTPDAKVTTAMNEINAQRRMRLAAQEQAEGQKIATVIRAEARAEAMHLAGSGRARERTAIVDGLCECVHDFTPGGGGGGGGGGGAPGTGVSDVIHLMVLTQYLDMLRDVGLSAVAREPATLIVAHSLDSVPEVVEQVRDGFAAMRRPR